ncbi:unnamed protein product [Plutella xylostella]|uniref:(diamondback moth) hypothetical protein n=1 Tax=Plutella xylostella TaxID=51655 RepID=A0A8S4G5H8_PLUXY|nr:unnamed protein product [Plutella xylostella]
MDMIASHHANSNFKGFWKCTNRLNAKPSVPVSVEGVSSPEEIAELFKNHFSVQSPLGSPCRQFEAGFAHGNISTVILAKDVRLAITKMTRGKSPGHDGLSIEHLQHAGYHLPRVLAMLFNLCLSHSYLPPDLVRTLVVPIVKSKTGDVSDKSNYRPISLATIVAKVLDSVLNSYLNKSIKLHDAQFGFRAGLSTESAILSVKHTIRYYTDRRTPVYGCFMDLSKAFDLVSYDILWRKLEEVGLPPELISLFRYWYLNQENRVRWLGKFSEPCRPECGVRQGGLSSPILFSLYINALIEGLSSMHIGCYIDGVCMNNFSYADDMVLLAPSVSALNELLAVCESYAKSHGLNYNTKKTEFMVFKSGTKVPTFVPPIRLNGVALRRAHQFKYLGHVLTEDLNDDADMERERRALSVRANMLARRFSRCTPAVKIALFKAYCTSLYSGSLWVRYTQKAYNALRIQFNNAFRALLRLPRFCSASAMFAEARTDGFNAIWRKKSASLLGRVRGSDSPVEERGATSPGSASSAPLGRRGSCKTSRERVEEPPARSRSRYGTYQNNFKAGRKSSSLMNLCDSGLGRATPPRRAASPGVRTLASPAGPGPGSGPGSLPGAIGKRRNNHSDDNSDASSQHSSIMDYSGPRLYKQPATKSNRGIMLNAVEYCVFPGAVNAEAKRRVLEEIARSESKHFLVLFRDAGCQFRALYSYCPDSEQVTKLYGTGPKHVNDRMFDKFFKYNSGSKCFSQVHTKHLTVTIDAFTIHNSLWQGKKVQLPSKKDMALVI